MKLIEIHAPSKECLVQQLNEDTGGVFDGEALTKVVEASLSESWEILDGEDYLAQLEKGIL